jgi:membrane-bound lytic murein transglycosylase B
MLAHDHGQGALQGNYASFAARHITPGRIKRGKTMLVAYAEPFEKIEQRYGVPAPVLVAIWGLETSFGADNGSFPTFDALATLAWDCRRPERFRAELIDALMLVQRGLVQHPRQLRGAWAGEIGQTQLMPSAYLMFATTPDGGGPPELLSRISIGPSCCRVTRPPRFPSGFPHGPGNSPTSTSPARLACSSCTATSMT